MRKLVALAVLSCSVAATTAPAADFGSWKYGLGITFSGYGKAETLTNFPALVILGSNLNGFAYSQFGSGSNADLRFADATQTNELNYEIDQWNTNGLSYVWVQVPQLTGTNTSIWAFWGQTGTNAPSYTTNGATWSNGFGAVWHFSEDPGGTQPAMRDSAGFVANNGTNYGMNSGNRVTGKVGTCLYFSGGSGGYVCAARQSEVNPTNAFTLSAWIRRDEIGAQHDIIEEYDWVAGYGTFNIRVRSNNLLGGSTIAGTSYTDVNGTTLLNNTGVWYYVAVTFDSSTRDFKAYVNGALDGTTPSATNPPAASVSLKIGAQGDNFSNRFKGLIDEPRVDTVARSSNWIWACYRNMASNRLFASTVSYSLPDIVNRPATNVTGTSASFNGTLNSIGKAAPTVLLYWGTNDGGVVAGNWGNTNTSIGIASVGPLSVSITTLATNTMYVYRYYATNTSGEIWAPSAEPLITGEIALRATDPAGAEVGPDTATFTVFRPAWATNAAQIVNYTNSGTAVNGVNYSNITGTVTIPAGATNAAILISPINDYTYQGGPRTVVLSLLPGGYLIGTQNTATAIIADQPQFRAAQTVPTNGMALWLKADAITILTNGASVTNWPDSGPVGYRATATNGTAPVFRTGVVGFNGNPTVRFDGTNQTMAVASYLGTVDMTLFVVGQFPNSVAFAVGNGDFQIEHGPNANTSYGFYVSGYNQYGALLNRPGRTAPAYCFGSINNDSSKQPWMGSGFAPGLTDVQCDTFFQQWSAWSNAVPLAVNQSWASGSPSGDVTDRLNIMSRDQSSGYGQGDIAELILYNRALAASDRQLVEGLLAWKYGMQGLLPSGHPWKNSDPTKDTFPRGTIIYLR